jgi:hypothetical protein
MNIRTRAATPATVFLLAAFVLLLLSCLSVPITKSIALGSLNGVTFGVFGFCINAQCSPVQLGYNPGLFGPLYIIDNQIKRSNLPPAHQLPKKFPDVRPLLQMASLFRPQLGMPYLISSLCMLLLRHLPSSLSSFPLSHIFVRPHIL